MITAAISADSALIPTWRGWPGRSTDLRYIFHTSSSARLPGHPFKGSSSCFRTKKRAMALGQPTRGCCWLARVCHCFRWMCWDAYHQLLVLPNHVQATSALHCVGGSKQAKLVEFEDTVTGGGNLKPSCDRPWLVFILQREAAPKMSSSLPAP